MGRKVRRAEPPAKPKQTGPAPPLELGQPSSVAPGLPASDTPHRGPGRPPGPRPVMVGKRRPGRPTKEEAAAKEIERRELEALRPEQARPLVGVVLHALCRAAKGDPPLERDIDLVTPPATAVANKYALSSRWAPELALVGCCFLVVQASRERRAERIAKLEKTPDRAALAQATPPAPASVAPPPVPTVPSLEAVVEAGASSGPHVWEGAP